VAAVCLLVPGALVLASCGGGSDEAEGGTVPASSATVITKKVPGYGTALATNSGKLLYVLTSDPEGGTKCVDSCVKQWKPLLGEGSPKAADGVKPDLLGTFKRDDGDQQVLYNKRALYTFTGEELAGAGTKALGGTWYLVDPDGKPIETTGVGGY
jgi:predicted lipoprotein with Yx(FWY)xxD motif